MPSKTHQSAVAVVPPQEVWGPIQAIRQRHDRQFRRWMPHINLPYPFYAPEQFNQTLPSLVKACAQLSTFTVTLAEFRFFLHSSRKATLWLAPEPRSPQGSLSFSRFEPTMIASWLDGLLDVTELSPGWRSWSCDPNQPNSCSSFRSS